jgi:hypothetical protein
MNLSVEDISERVRKLGHSFHAIATKMKEYKLDGKTLLQACHNKKETNAIFTICNCTKIQQEKIQHEFVEIYTMDNENDDDYR